MDRLLGLHGTARRLTLEQYRESLARDLEDLLNTRTALAPELLQAFPECARSVLTFGLADFSGLSLGSSDDRARVCARVRQAVERHDPRLQQVQVRVADGQGRANHIDITISGLLRLPGVRTPVSFNVTLQPSSMHYCVKRGANA